MERKSQKQLEDNFIDQKLAEAFGYQDEQLAEELDTVAAEAGDDLPRAPAGRLWIDLNARSPRELQAARRSACAKWSKCWRPLLFWGQW